MLNYKYIDGCLMLTDDQGNLLGPATYTEDEYDAIMDEVSVREARRKLANARNKEERNKRRLERTRRWNRS